MGCSTPDPEVNISPFRFHNPGKLDLSGQRFIASDDSPLPTIVLFDSSEDAEQYWQKTGKWIAYSGYRLLLVTSWEIGTDDSLMLSHALSEEYSQEAAVIGVGAGSNIAVRLAAADSNLKALITIDAADYLDANAQSFLQSIPPRPHLLIETTQTPQHPDPHKLALFEKAHDPKKIVWLATDQKPSEILRSDLEPIVRRAVLLLTDRYVKKTG